MTRSPPQPVAALLGEAVAAHRAGQLAAADMLYDKVLKADRANADALNLKGLIAAARGDHGGALALLDRAVRASPRMADAHANRGNALAALGRGDEALAAYREAVRLKPAHLEAWLNAGTLFYRGGRLKDAADIFREGTRVCPDTRLFYNLGQTLRDLAAADESVRKSVLEEAVATLERAIALDTAFAPAQISLGAALADLGLYQKAAAAFETAIALKASAGDQERREILNNLGEVLRKDGQNTRAVATLRRALALGPLDPTIRYNLALALTARGETGEAEAIYRSLIADTPDFLKPYINLGNLYRDQNRTDAALALYEQALTRDPMLAEAYTNLGAGLADKGWLLAAVLQHHKALALKPADATTGLSYAVNLLRLGRFHEGWPPYENRFQAGTLGRRAPPPFWQGEDLRGKTILVWTEQGVGDEVIYASMIPDLIARAQVQGGRCKIECSQRMLPVFRRSFPTIAVEGWETTDRPVFTGDIDFQIAAGSLGRYLRPSFGSFPRHNGFLAADPARTARLRAAYAARAGGRRIVGIAWRSRNTTLGPFKSAGLANLDPILMAKDCFFVNLQYGDCAAEVAAARERAKADIFMDPDVDHVADIDGAFAQAAAMDVVITTSNSAAHMTASQNVPTWILLPHAKGVLWYWFAQREDSPWYPAARLFRAPPGPEADPWETRLAGRVADALARFTPAPGGRP